MCRCAGAIWYATSVEGAKFNNAAFDRYTLPKRRPPSRRSGGRWRSRMVAQAVLAAGADEAQDSRRRGCGNLAHGAAAAVARGGHQEHEK